MAPEIAVRPLGSETLACAGVVTTASEFSPLRIPQLTTRCSQ